MAKFNRIPDFESLVEGKKSYLEIDKKELEERIRTLFTGQAHKILVLPLRKLKKFVNGEANLYSNDFVRHVEFPEELGETFEDKFNNKMLKCERMRHRDKVVAVSIDYDENEEFSFKVIDSTEYFHNDNFWFFKGVNNTTYLYVVQASGRIDLFSKDISLYAAVGEFDDDPEAFAELDYVFERTIKYFPYIEWTYEDIVAAEPHPIIDVQNSYIKHISYGFFNAAFKLTSQLSIEGDVNEAKADEIASKANQTEQVLTVPHGSKIKEMQYGDLTPLKQLSQEYADIISSEAQQRGIDITSLFPDTAINESGEAKKARLNYINTTRKDWMYSTKIFEKTVIDKISELTGKEIKYEGISFLDIQSAGDKNDRRRYAADMMRNGFWNFQLAVSHVWQTTYQKAEEIIKEYGLDPSAIYLNENDDNNNL